MRRVGSPAGLEGACKTQKNVMLSCRPVCESEVYEGEVFQVFRRSFGQWKPPVLVDQKLWYKGGL